MQTGVVWATRLSSCSREVIRVLITHTCAIDGAKSISQNGHGLPVVTSDAESVVYLPGRAW